MLESSAAIAAHGRLAAWLDSPRLPDNQVLPLATAVLRQSVGQAGTAELPAGSSECSDLGRVRRKRLLGRLTSEQVLLQAEPVPAGTP